MRELLRLLIHVADSQMARERPSLVTRTVCGLIAGFFMLAAAGCGVAALWIALLPSLGPAGAPLAIAGLLFVIGLVFLLVARRRPVLVVADPAADPRHPSAGSPLSANRSALLLALFTAAFQSGARR
ncbi:phage holin family protein [Gellertiella hungarica]|uniref:Holin-X, holin superfamily III n=1 Tax=Gellertiella hungarica TaxID=1572859 RepID=A0A7W6J2X2_9HYPH|nr:phage holin family protein [Gellertiella hungarica]MBB4062898.1 hypothetical protein [Gellertiella hungarica]